MEDDEPNFTLVSEKDIDKIISEFKGKRESIRSNGRLSKEERNNKIEELLNRLIESSHNGVLRARENPSSEFLKPNLNETLAHFKISRSNLTP